MNCYIGLESLVSHKSCELKFVNKIGSAGIMYELGIPSNFKAFMVCTNLMFSGIDQWEDES